MLVFTERCLNITQVNGLKKYDPDASGYTHTLETVKIVNTRAINSTSYPSYTQDSCPYTHVAGRKAETFTIDGVLCEVTKVAPLLDSITNRNVNTLYNVFLPCSILTVSENTDHGEFPLGTDWIVESFTISRTSQRRSVILFSLVVSRYYEAI